MNELDLKIEQVLKDLYQIDPLFKQHEAKIRQIIKEVILAKPDTKFDEAFALSLRHKLMTQADLIKENQSLSLLTSLKMFKRLNYAISTVAVIIIVVGAGILWRQNRVNVSSPASKNQPLLFSSGTKVTPVSNNAFGRLAAASPVGTATGMGGGGAASAPSEFSAPQADNKSIAPSIPLGMGGGAGGTMPAFISYNYVYKGDKFTVDKNQMEIYRRINTPATGASAASLLKSMNFGIINMDSFSNLAIQSLNLVEDKEYGYNFYINLQDGVFSASEDWLRWPNPEAQCKTDECFNALRLKMSDIPDDQTLISMADQFLKDHNISTESYGTPFVNNDWKIAYSQATDQINSFIPNILTVIYPQKINGNEVNDAGGNPTGFAVSIDARAKRVSGFSELYAQNYQSSLYDTETSWDKILGYAEKGGYNGGYYSEQGGRTVDVELGTPHLAYIKTYQPMPALEKGQSNEILVPALIFPVTKPPQGQTYYQKNVVVPLAKDLWPQNETNPPVRIMPAQPAQ